MKTKTIALLLAVALVFGGVVGGTIAWLTDTTESVVNTFTPSDVDIELTETVPEDYTAKMVPGATISKDPKVTVEAGSEACWLFVKITESGGNITIGEKTYTFSDFLTYAVDSNWTELEDGVYYCKVAASNADQTFAVLAGDTVTVKDTVTKAMMNALTADTYPTLTFTAYAIQSANLTDSIGTAVSTAAGAWALISGT